MGWSCNGGDGHVDDEDTILMMLMSLMIMLMMMNVMMMIMMTRTMTRKMAMMMMMLMMGMIDAKAGGSQAPAFSGILIPGFSGRDFCKIPGSRDFPGRD